jgi:hypothetical protein
MLKKITIHVGVYLAWLFSSALAAYVALKAWEAILQVYIALRLSRWGYAAVHHFSIVIIGLAWLVCVLFIESYYRIAVGKGQLPRRILRVTLIQLAILVVVFAIHYVAV